MSRDAVARTWTDPRLLLRHAGLYKAFQTLIGGRRARKRFVQHFVQPAPGDKILDIGCGPGDILDFLPDVEYYGFDVDPAYIATARRTYGERGTFVCERVDTVNVPDPGTFDLVLAAGVLHHLNDEEARSLLDVSAKALKPEGRLVTMDGCFIEKQPAAARLLLKADRGTHVREQAHYEELAYSAFKHVTSSVEEHFFRVPYTLLIMHCITAVDVSKLTNGD